MKALLMGRLLDPAEAEVVAERLDASGTREALCGTREALCRTPRGNWFLHTVRPDGAQEIKAITAVAAFLWCDDATRFSYFGTARIEYFGPACSW